MLAAVAYSAERLLLSSDWRDAIDDVLMHLGVAAGVSRAYLIEVGTPETGFRATQLAEWCAPGVASQFENPTLRGTPLAEAGFSRWIELMSSRATVHGVISEFPEEERLELAKQDIRSIAAFPVFVDGDWWAFIGFDDCVDDRGVDGVRARLTPRGGGGARRGRAGRPRRRTPTARRGQVPAARGAEPGRHVHGVARSGGWAVDLRQPPAPGPARICARGPARRSRLVVGARPSRGPRRCAGREPDRLLAGHPVRPDVPDANGGRNVGLGAGRGSPDPGRRRPDPVLAGLPRRRDRTRRDRGAAPRGRGSVPGDGRADPGGDLHRSRRPRRA